MPPSPVFNSLHVLVTSPACDQRVAETPWALEKDLHPHPCLLPLLSSVNLGQAPNCSWSCFLASEWNPSLVKTTRHNICKTPNTCQVPNKWLPLAVHLQWTPVAGVQMACSLPFFWRLPSFTCLLSSCGMMTELQRIQCLHYNKRCFMEAVIFKKHVLFIHSVMKHSLSTFWVPSLPATCLSGQTLGIWDLSIRVC